MQPDQTLQQITCSVLTKIPQVFETVKPVMTLIHGDTTTTLAAALASFYAKIPIGHVEAGLRTGNKYQPYPEEMNRTMIAPLVDLHFAPTDLARSNLLEEGVRPAKVFVTGNTGVDALMMALKLSSFNSPRYDRSLGPFVLLTIHRRENFGQPLKKILQAIRHFAEENPDVTFVYPVHPNPNIKPVAESILGDIKNIHLIPPVDYFEMAHLLKHCLFVATDSGGLQEEAPSLGKKVIVFRDKTERPEAVDAGFATIVGSDTNRIVASFNEHLRAVTAGTELPNRSPFGDGTAGDKIRQILESWKPITSE
jgi:UDP-N-acetylglucosamine 2-epimerase (non-hydrolysing)